MTDFKRVKIKKIRKYFTRNQDKIPSTDGKRCFLCTRGHYHAINGKGRECPVCSVGRLPETKEHDYDFTNWVEREYFYCGG